MNIGVVGAIMKSPWGAFMVGKGFGLEDQRGKLLKVKVRALLQSPGS